MLLNLFIKDFGIIEQMEIQLNKGFNVLTGETGAGKSIVLESLQVALGGRASVEYIRSGSERSFVRGTFDVGSNPGIEDVLVRAGINPEEDGIIVLGRELNKSGRNICRVNGQVVPLSQYRLIGQSLVDMQGQNEQYSLLDPGHQLELLDCFGGEEALQTALRVSSIYKLWRDSSEQVKELRARTGDMARRVGFLQYQLEDIDAAGLKPGEYEELIKEKSILANAEKIKRLVDECHSILYSGGGGVIPVVDLLGRSCRFLEELSGIDQGMDTYKDSILNCLYLIEDVARDLAGYLDSVDFNPFRLETVENRLAKIEGLFKKYGSTIEEIINYREAVETELNGLKGSEEKLGLLEKQQQSLGEDWSREAGMLTDLRKRTAARLQDEVARELADLEMDQVYFKVVFTRQEGMSEKGGEKVEFNISPNPGEPLRPLGKIASGGEVSRIMLAIKTILAEMDNVPTMVFDEVEAGIGGRALHAVTEKLLGLGQKRQVICVTHAAVVAAVAGTHYHIYKEQESGRTISRVKILEGEERVNELARMLGGRDTAGAALDHARQLLISI